MELLLAQLYEQVLICVVASEISLYSRCLHIFVSLHDVNDVTFVTFLHPSFLDAASRHDSFLLVIAILPEAD